ncbi:MAG TPA: hypothetical protein VEV87_05750 [Chitinophagaceae bacterium]|nr:hypothetical protein [Chitinophagaceae bacterium]
MLLGSKSIGLALAGLAAYAYYKYSKMTADEKRDLTNNIKEKGKKIFGSLVPESKNGSVSQEFGQSSTYGG